MKLLLSCALFLSSIYQAVNSQQLTQCRSISVRREVRSIPANEWNSIQRTLTRIRDDGWLAWMARVHTDNFGVVHGNPMFFPFHRMVLYDFERVGRRYDPNFSVPYWDSARDFSRPAASSVLSPRYIGTNGAGPNNCVSNGIQGGWQVSYPTRRCLRRVYNNGNAIQPWYSPEFVESLTQRSTTLDSFRSGLEYSLHGAVHIGMGGDMGAREAPNDLAFMLHHANLDRIWWRWQKIGQNMMKYDGNGPSGRVSLDNRITVYGDTVSSVMRLGYGKMCFSYDTDPIGRNGFGKRDSLSPSGLNLTNVDASVLTKYFPLTAKEVGTRHSGMKSERILSSADGSYKMPYPFPMSESFAKMHGYNLEVAKKVRKDAVDLIDDLQKYGYRSPYYQGA
ncbi:hypothetical protein BB560_001761 [Smittium megazygosporum]|uniref:Tyrosinase copper-binding domain-containing protein n=1 Tax=Smittium megazygosporum TaxID=133381 RepID=A0A2T9ZGP7_9FUNG|nr:hypothetical protein BB560_001761 [Smittium megazygosporum]